MTQTQEVKKYRSKDLQLWQDVRNQNCHKPEDYNLTKESFSTRCELYSLIDAYRFDSLTYVRDASIKMYELFASGDLTYTHIRSLVRCIDPKFWLPMIDMIKGMNTKDVYPFLVPARPSQIATRQQQTVRPARFTSAKNAKRPASVLRGQRRGKVVARSRIRRENIGARELGWVRGAKELGRRTHPQQSKFSGQRML